PCLRPPGCEADRHAWRAVAPPSLLDDISARHGAGAPVSRRWLSVSVRDKDAPKVSTAPSGPVVAHLHRVALQEALVVPAHAVELDAAARVAAGARAVAI